MTTLYERLGGEGAVGAVVDKFYDYLFVDEKIKHFFLTTDMEKQRLRQKQFITLVTGGPNNYQGKDMKEAHSKLKISREDFDITWAHLATALRFYKVSEVLVE
jgi:hemoglobin